MTVSEVLDDSAPRMAVSPAARSAVTDWVAMFVEVSPESFWVMLILMPCFAALMSATAMFEASIAGGPRVASDPVCGSIVPMFSVSVLLGVPDPPDVPEQPLRTSVAAPRPATPASAARRVFEREAVAFTNCMVLLSELLTQNEDPTTWGSLCCQRIGRIDVEHYELITDA